MFRMGITTYANPDNATSVVTTIQYTNSITSEAFMPVMIFVIWLVLFITLKQWRTEAALSSSLFATMIMTIILRTAGLVTDTLLVISIVAFLAAFFMVIMSKEEYG